MLKALLGCLVLMRLLGSEGVVCAWIQKVGGWGLVRARTAGSGETSRPSLGHGAAEGQTRRLKSGDRNPDRPTPVLNFGPHVLTRAGISMISVWTTVRVAF